MIIMKQVASKYSFPKIRKSTIQGYRYQVGRDNRGYWSLCHTLAEVIKLWFEYL
jgi:hypothetical protein